MLLCSQDTGRGLPADAGAENGDQRPGGEQAGREEGAGGAEGEPHHSDFPAGGGAGRRGFKTNF